MSCARPTGKLSMPRCTPSPFQRISTAFNLRCGRFAPRFMPICCDARRPRCRTHSQSSIQCLIRHYSSLEVRFVSLSRHKHSRIASVAERTPLARCLDSLRWCVAGVVLAYGSLRLMRLLQPQRPTTMPAVPTYCSTSASSNHVRATLPAPRSVTAQAPCK